MTSELNALASTRHLVPKVTQVIDRFRQAWNDATSADTQPDLSAFISEVADPALRRQAVVALVAVDLESRYRHGSGEHSGRQPTSPCKRLLESYLETFPELGATIEQVPIELIGDEYRVRKLYGDQPTRDEYLRRFPQHRDRLDAILSDVDAELRQQSPDALDTVGLSAPTDGIAATQSVTGTHGAADTDHSRPALRVKDHFVFGTKLGEGGMGAVYSATDQLLGRSVAIKVVRTQWHADERARTQFFREAQLASRLQHPGICPVYEVGLIYSPDASASEPVPFIAMKRVEGQTLAEALKANRDEGLATRGRWLEVFGEIADAVAYAHERGVIHRDLKPANVMLGAHGETQVMDWGLAKYSLQATNDGGGTDSDTSATQFGTVKGTWAYMPPEQATGRTDQIDSRADVFALGSILCQILTGEPAYVGGANVVIDAARTGDLRDAKTRLAKSGADEQLIQLTLRCLEPQPEDRLADAGEVASRIASYQANVERRLQEAEVAAEKERGERLAAAERLRATRWRMRLAVTTVIFVTVSATAGWLYVQSAVTTAAAQHTYAAQLDQQANSLLVAAVTESWNDVAWSRYVENRRFSATARQEAEKRLGWLLSVPGLAAVTGTAQTRTLARQAELELATAQRDRDFCLAIREAKLQGTAVRGDAFDFARELTAYRQALADYAVEIQRPQEAAAIINASAIRDDLVGVLDELLQYSIVLSEWDRAPRTADIERLLNEVDPNPTRQALRTHLADALKGTDAQTTIEALVHEWSFQDHPFATSLVLCNVLGKYDPPRAIQSLIRIVEQDPRLFEAHNELGYRYLMLQPPDQTAALAHWQAAAALAPDSAGVNLNLGNLLSDFQRYEEAEACYRRAIKLQPDYASAHQNLASVLSEMGKNEQAVSHYRKAIALREDPLAYSSLGKTLVNMNRHDEAEVCFRKSIELAPDYPPTYHDLAMLLDRQRRPKEAEASFRESIQRCERTDRPWESAFSIGSIAADQIDLKQAEAAARHDLGVMLARQNRLEEAEDLYRKSLELMPGLAQAHRSLGDLLASTRRLDEAEESYRQSIQLTPDPVGYINLAKLLSEQQRFEEAELLFRRAIEEFPNDQLLQAHLGLGAILFYQNRLDEAELSLRKAVELQGDLPTAVSNLGGLLVAQKKYEEGERYLRKAIELDPMFVSPYVNLAILLRQQGCQDDAEALLRNGLTHLENNGMLHCHLGRVLWERGEFDQAVDSLKRGHELGSMQPGWSLPSKQWLTEAERDRAAEQVLEGILQGNSEPENAEQLVLVALFCQQLHQRRYQQSVQFYQKAFDRQPELAQVSPQSQHRYNAACAAALASTGVGTNAGELDPERQVALRELARQWLEADLQQWAEWLDPPATRAAAERALNHWLSDSDLASVREPAELDKLPIDERKQWESLWSNVRDTLADGVE